MTHIIQKELSYKIVGILMDIHRELENRYQEKYYQRAVAIALRKNGLNFKQELSVNLNYAGEKIGRYSLDFLIENTIVLEIKCIPELKPIDFKQVLAYLKAERIELGILANFRPESLVYKRILNSDLLMSNN